MLEQWKALERQGMKVKQLTKQPYLDESLLEVWNIYCLISQGVENVTLQDIQAYCVLYDDKLEAWKIDAILGLDRERLKEWQTQLQD